MFDVEFVTKKASVMLVLPVVNEIMVVEEKKELVYLVSFNEEPIRNISCAPVASASVARKKVLRFAYAWISFCESVNAKLVLLAVILNRI